MEGRKIRKHIELFAGCGGMTLGLKAAGFELVFANELSPMASETFAMNLLDEDLETLGNNKEISDKVLWLRSDFPRDELKNRLKENPFMIKNPKGSDLTSSTNLFNKLLVGDIRRLRDFLIREVRILNSIKGVDILSGGPPCQGFSLAGRRFKDDAKNLLPWEFAEIARLIEPKIILLENVQGITAAFRQGENIYYAWLEVAKAFALKEYIPICLLINSKYFGIPQNRPRFIYLGFRRNVFEKLQDRYKDFKARSILNESWRFYHKVKENQTNLNNVTTSDLKYYTLNGLNKDPNAEAIKELIQLGNYPLVTAKQAISNIEDPQKKYYLKDTNCGYVKNLNETFIKEFDGNSILTNHDPRTHTFNVKARFRLYQIINELPTRLKSVSS